MKVIIDLPLQSMVLEVSPLLLNALNQAMIVSKNYEQGIRYIVEESQQPRMHFMDDAEFDHAVLDKKESVSNG
jgi:hypothetical protein